MRWTAWREWLLAGSLANICLIHTWSWLLGRSVLIQEASSSDFVAAICNEVLLTVLWWLLLRLPRQAERYPLLKLLRPAPLVAVPIALHYLWMSFSETVNVLVLLSLIGEAGVWVATTGVVLVCGVVLWKQPPFLLRATETFFLVLSPLLVMTLAQSVWQVAIAETPPRHDLSAVRVYGPPSTQRVIWFVFDEMDYRLAFSERPSNLQLPALDRFRETALHATRAMPPAADTLTSVPSMLTGRVFARSVPTGDDLAVSGEAGGRALSFRSLPTVFTAASAAGFATGVVGWFIPYCRLRTSDLEECFWLANSGLFFRDGSGLLDRVVGQLHLILGPWKLREQHLARYQAILGRTQTLLQMGNLDLLYVHWPIPHGYGIYDRRKNQFIASPFYNQKEWYLDNLALTDRTLGQIRQAMEEAGTWESSTVLLTSDHPWRMSPKFDGRRDPRIPFLVKLAGQDQALTYDRTFNTVLVHDLILSLLHGEIGSPNDLVNWLDRARARNEFSADKFSPPSSPPPASK